MARISDDGETVSVVGSNGGGSMPDRSLSDDRALTNRYPLEWHVSSSWEGYRVIRYYRDGDRVGLACIPGPWIRTRKKAEEISQWANDNLLQAKPHLWWLDDEPQRVTYGF